MDVTDTIVRGEQAKALLENETLQAAFKAMRDKINTDWRATGALNIDERERLWLALRLVDELEETLHRFISTGMLEQETIKQKNLFEKLKDTLNV